MRSNPEKLLSRRDVLVIACVVLFSLAVYLLSSASLLRIGFPLDDAWIHQTYARNLAMHGEWSFIPGQPSAGSTAPLWTGLLAIGFWLNLSPYIWSFFLGGLILLGICLLAELILRQSLPGYAPRYPWIGLMFGMEWHLCWAAFSGMETILHIFLILLAVRILLVDARHYLEAGIIIGVTIWVRPDGLTLLAPFLLAILLKENTLSLRSRGLLSLFLGFGFFFLPYLLFNLLITGAPMPNTFYAKQAEYTVWQSTPLAQRLLVFALQFFQGISIALIPGFLQKVVRGLRQRAWGLLLTAGWIIGYIFLYVLRLPVYQHGRYIMPAMAVFFLLGFSGLWESFSKFSDRRVQILRVSMVSFFAAILFISSMFGAYIYAQDVSYIESEMVDTAKWVAQNVPAGALLAAHDIGALGYFDQHPIVDLAGLISKDVVPFMNDDVRLSEYMDERNVEYLVAFSGWRPGLTGRGTQIYNTSNNNTGNMAVYLWK